MPQMCARWEVLCTIKSTSGLTKCLGEMQQDVIHHMGRRCRDWNYGGRAIYMITVNLKERERPVLAEWPRFLGVSAKAQNHPAQNRPVSTKAKSQPVSGQAQELEIDNASAVVCASAETPKFKAHFQAIGNTGLLQMPVMLPVQCSRRDFAYRRERLATGGWKILHNAAGEPLVESTSPAFEKKCEDALICAIKGAVLVSPCISHGEREIARRAHAAGVRVIALRNKGFAPFEKPNGALFDQCAKGNLLLLAPAAWPYIPDEKPPTRESSLVLNRIAQLLVGNGETEIKYNGMVFNDIDAKVFEALQSPQNGDVA